MPCSSCNVQFNLFKRKRLCGFCNRSFCLTCLDGNKTSAPRSPQQDEKIKTKTCSICRIIFRKPCPLKDEVMNIKTKELIFYLHLLKISFKNCVEKEELVNLLINNINVGKPDVSSPPPNGHTFEDYASFEQIRNKCQNLLSSFSERINSDIQNISNLTSRSDRTGTNGDDSSSAFEVLSNLSMDDATNPDENSLSQHSHTHQQQQKPGTSKDFFTASTSKSRSKNFHPTNNSSDSYFDNSEEARRRSNSRHIFNIPNDNVRPLYRRKSDSNLLLKTQSSSIDNSPLPRQSEICQECEITRERMRLKLCNIKKHLERIEYSQNLEIQNIKKMINDSLESLRLNRSISSSTLSVSTPRQESATVEPEAASNSITQIASDSATLMESNAELFNDNERILVCPMIIEVHQGQTSPTAVENPSGESSSDQSTSKRFFTLDDVKSKEDFEDLSVKQLKEILSVNRVNFKGCCEKDELKERALRLWNDHVSTLPIEKMPNEDLCKICFSAGVACVFLECGHCCTCVDCGKILSECPVCRSYITRVVRVFKS